MKNALIILLLLINIQSVSGQALYDSIFTSNEGVISATIKEVAIDAVIFMYPNEDVLNTLPKSRIQKIVFKSGRVQIFSESTTYKKVTGVRDWQNVSISKIESEIQGLFKIGVISVKAKSSGLGSSSRINDRAISKLKMEAALQGANIVYIMSETSVGNKAGTQYQAGQAAETQISGITYSNSLPKYSDFKIITKGKNTFLAQKDDLGNNSATYSSIQIPNLPAPIEYSKELNGFIYVRATIVGSSRKEFRVTYFDKTKIVLMEEEKGRIKNYTLIIQ